jgi:hypothetical protein
MMDVGRNPFREHALFDIGLAQKQDLGIDAQGLVIEVTDVRGDSRRV